MLAHVSHQLALDVVELRRDGAGQRSGLPKTSTAAVHSGLRNGLDHKSRHPTARAGLAASSAFRLYRAARGWTQTNRPGSPSPVSARTGRGHRASSIDEAASQVAVGVDPAVAEERPDATHLLYPVPIDLDEE